MAEKLKYITRADVAMVLGRKRLPAWMDFCIPKNQRFFTALDIAENQPYVIADLEWLLHPSITPLEATEEFIEMCKDVVRGYENGCPFPERGVNPINSFAYAMMHYVCKIAYEWEGEGHDAEGRLEEGLREILRRHPIEEMADSNRYRKG